MATVIIELDFEHLLPHEVTDADVFNYLMELIDNDCIGYEVQ